MKLVVIFSVLIANAAALNCFKGTLMVGSYNKLPTKDCGDIDHCINATIANDDGGLIMADCDTITVTNYGQPDGPTFGCPKNAEMNSCTSVDIVGADNVTSTATVCCCDDDWCNKSAFSLHSLGLSLLLISVIKWIQ